MKGDVYQIITDRIIQLLESGTVPWRKPWAGGNQLPQNFVSRKPYRGINLFLLNSTGYSSPFWLTFRQINMLGGKVKKGERSFPVVFWKILKDEQEGEEKRIIFLRYYSVFNIAQCEGIVAPEMAVRKPEVKRIETCERVVAAMPKPPVIHHHGLNACYSPIKDEISMPAAELFTAVEEYYSTLFHELTHATGHVSRLNRKEVAEPNRFGSEPYSREELVAEMGAAFLCGHCEIEQKTVENSAGYIQGWLEQLKNDRKLVVHAGAQAQKAADFILDVKHEDDAPNEPQPKEHKVVDPVPESMRMPARTLKIEEIGDFWKGEAKPRIRLMGRWLQRAGFEPGNRVNITCAAPGVIELRSSEQVESDHSGDGKPECPF